MGCHPTAQVPLDGASVVGLEVGAFSVLEEGVVLGSRVRVGSFCHVHSCVTLEEDVSVYDGCVLGSPPQDRKFRGEPSRVLVGARTVLREYVTVNAATAASAHTVVGADCLVMAYCHVAHDCRLADGVVLANGVQMGGHVTIGAGTVVSGMTGIHQFTTIGDGVFIGGGLRVARDVPPFSRALGEPLRWAGVNVQALERMHLPGSAESVLKSAYKEYFAGAPREVFAQALGGDPGFAGARESFRDFFAQSTRGKLK